MNVEAAPCETCTTSLEQSVLCDEVTCFKTCRDWARWKGIQVVAIAGGFDPFHDGHLQHIEEAMKLGDYLVVLVSNDNDMIRKKGKCNIPLKARMRIVNLILKGLGFLGEAIATIDEDGTQAKTLKAVRPNIFAKGGDRTPDNMPENEIRACKEIGCKIVYGVGGQINQSSKMVLA